MRKTVLLSLGALVAVAALFTACGGGGDSSSSTPNGHGDSTSNIRVGKGLAVANISNGSATSQNSAGGSAADLAAPAPAAEGAGGAVAADGRSASSAGSNAASQPDQQAISNTGITVQGYGTASADADSAVVEFSFSNSNVYNGTPVPPDASGNVKPDVSSPGTVTEITKADLQPVIDALTGAGVSASDIEFLDQGYYDPYYSSATLRATIKSIGSVDTAVQAAQNAAANLDGISLQSTNLTYTLQDCSALEKAAMQAAVSDAHDRAGILASAIGVTLGTVSGASDYSYSPYGSPCSGGYFGPWPMASIPYRVGGAAQGQVQVVSNISVTYSFS